MAAAAPSLPSFTVSVGERTLQQVLLLGWGEEHACGGAGRTGSAMRPGLQRTDLQVPNNLTSAPLPALLTFVETS